MPFSGTALWAFINLIVLHLWWIECIIRTKWRVGDFYIFSDSTSYLFVVTPVTSVLSCTKLPTCDTDRKWKVETGACAVGGHTVCWEGLVGFVFVSFHHLMWKPIVRNQICLLDKTSTLFKLEMILARVQLQAFNLNKRFTGNRKTEHDQNQFPRLLKNILAVYL